MDNLPSSQSHGFAKKNSRYAAKINAVNGPQYEKNASISARNENS
jgi:hypothetical protein